MPHHRPAVAREDLLLGLAAGAVFAAYRAVSASADGTADRLAEFAANLMWPGVLILAGVGAAVWFGWKANID